MLESMLQKAAEDQPETTVAFSDGWEEVDAMELNLANQLRFATVNELEALMDEYGAETLDDLEKALDAVLAAADEEESAGA